MPIAATGLSFAVIISAVGSWIVGWWDSPLVLPFVGLLVAAVIWIARIVWIGREIHKQSRHQDKKGGGWW